jgi:hypothetical protein
MTRVAEWALLAFVVTMGFERPAPPIPGHAQWSDVAMALAAVALLIATITRRVKLRVGAAGWAGLAYAGWGVASALANGTGGWKALGMCELACVLIVTATLASAPDARARIVKAWLVGAALSCALGLIGTALYLLHVESSLWDPSGGSLSLPTRPTGLAAGFNLLAELALVPLLLLVGNPRLAGRARRPLLWLYGATLALSLSRTLLAVALGCVWLMVKLPRSLRVTATVVVLLATIASARLDLYRDPSGQMTISTAPGLRWRLAASAAETAARHPLFGLGPGELVARVAWPRATDPFQPVRAHWTPLDLAATLGVPGLLLFALTFALACRRGRADRVLLVGALATAFDGLTVDIESFRHVWLLLGLLAAGGPSDPMLRSARS